MLNIGMADLTLLEERAVSSAMNSARRIFHPAYLKSDMRQEAMLGVLLARVRCKADNTAEEQQAYYARRALGAIIDGLREVLRQDGRSRTGSKRTGEHYAPSLLVPTDTPDDSAPQDHTRSEDDPLGTLLVARALEAIAKMPVPLPALAHMCIAGSSGTHIAATLGVDPSRVSVMRATLATKLRKYL
jgi:hypothetical protein